MTLPEVVTDNGPIDRNFRALDERTPPFIPGWGGSYGTPSMSVPTAATVTADRVYYARIQVLSEATITGVQYFVVNQAGNVRAALYDSTGARVANRTTDAAVGASLAAQQVAFDATYSAPPGIYYLALVFSDVACQTYFAVPQLPASYAAGPGSTATATSITPPTTLAQSVPTMSTY